MAIDPTRYVVEVLGEPADRMRNPANAGYQCPFVPGECTKRSQSLDGPFPVCTVHRRGRAEKPPTGPPICVCPNRLFESDLTSDLIEHCWVGPKPENPQVAHEVHMEKFGTVDFVVADVEPRTRSIRDFVSVELQAVDITGSYLPAYTAVTNSQVLEKAPTYGFNWANVRKRFVSQLISKGFYHHHWGTRVAAVLQQDLFDEFVKHADITRVPPEQSNIIFMIYQYMRTANGSWELGLQDVCPTTHANVMTSILYERPPSRSAFEEKIRESL